jgi:hypothetical protein
MLDIKSGYHDAQVTASQGPGQGLARNIQHYMCMGPASGNADTKTVIVEGAIDSGPRSQD